MNQSEYSEIYTQAPDNSIEGMQLMGIPAPFGIWSRERLFEKRLRRQKLFNSLGATGLRNKVEISKSQDDPAAQTTERAATS